MSDLERETRAWSPSLAKWQREEIRKAGERLIELAGDAEADGRREATEALERAFRKIAGFELRDFRTLVRCAGCWEPFTSVATRRQHYDGRGGCTDPAAVPSLQLKSRGRWGWSEAAVEELGREKGARRGAER